MVVWRRNAFAKNAGAGRRGAGAVQVPDFRRLRTVPDFRRMRVLVPDFGHMRVWVPKSGHMRVADTHMAGFRHQANDAARRTDQFPQARRTSTQQAAPELLGSGAAVKLKVLLAC